MQFLLTQKTEIVYDTQEMLISTHQSDSQTFVQKCNTLLFLQKQTIYLIRENASIEGKNCRINHQPDKGCHSVDLKISFCTDGAHRGTPPKTCLCPLFVLHAQLPLCSKSKWIISHAFRYYTLTFTECLNIDNFWNYIYRKKLRGHCNIICKNKYFCFTL